MVVERHVRRSMQYAQTLIAMYSLFQKENDRRTVHQKLMIPFRSHLVNVYARTNILVERLDVFAAAVSRVDGQTFLAAQLQGFGAYIAEFLRALRVIGPGLEYMIGILGDEVVAPNSDYTRHPAGLPAVPEARRRLTMAASLKKAAQRALRNLRGRDRLTVLSLVRRWDEIIRVARNKQAELAADRDVAMDVDA